jgi:alpha-D-ribose 1-methylphosphonate 5-triphosphate synthase subunit PhnH
VLAWHGPGIQTEQRVRLQGLPPEFWTQWQANHASFPQGVDIIFTCGDSALGLPRTTRVHRLEGV